MANIWANSAATGANDGTSFADGYTDFTNAWTDYEASNNNNIYAYGTFNLAAVLTHNVNGSNTTYNEIVGVNASGVEDGTQVELNGGGGSYDLLNFTSASQYIVFRNVIFKNVANTLIEILDVSSDHIRFENCTFDTASRGYSNIASNKRVHFENCEFTNCTYGTYGAVYAYKCKIHTNTTGAYSGYSCFVDCLIYNNTTGINIFNASHYIGCVVDDCTTGLVSGASGYPYPVIYRLRITNCTTGIDANSSTTVNYALTDCYFYNPSGTDISGTYSNDLNLLGDTRYTADNSSDGYEDQALRKYNLTISADGVGIENVIGLDSETDNEVSTTQGPPPYYATSTAPTFAGITKFEALSNGWFYVEWNAATGTKTSYNIYIHTATNPFGQLPIKVDDTVTSAYIKTLGDMSAFLAAGTTYYCGVRAENNGTEDANVVEISNVCVGSELIQRMDITVVTS